MTIPKRKTSNITRFCLAVIMTMCTITGWMIYIAIHSTGLAQLLDIVLALLNGCVLVFLISLLEQSLKLDNQIFNDQVSFYAQMKVYENHVEASNGEPK